MHPFRFLWAFVFLLCFSGFLHAQPADFFVVNKITIRGNKVTQPQLILRELTFGVGDTLPAKPLEEWVVITERNRYNLYNLGLFNFVSVGASDVPAEGEIIVEVVERWYIWPEPILRIAENNFNSWWENRDFSRLTGGLTLTHKNFRGRGEQLKIDAKAGFTNQLAISYAIPWVNRQKTLGWHFEVSGAQQREINVSGFDNRQVFFEAENATLLESFGVKSGLTFRSKLYSLHQFDVGFKHVSIADTALSVNPDYSWKSLSKLNFFSLGYRFRHDKRDRVFYPLTGFLFEGMLQKDGLGLLNNQNLNLLDLMLTWHHHFQLSKKWFSAFGFESKTNLLDNPPYYFQRGLGYLSRNVRSYELYVMDGQAYRLLKSTIKYQLLNRANQQLSFWKHETYGKYFYEIYLNAFFDAGYVGDEVNAATNRLSNEWQYGGGIGLDFATIYDRVIRLEVSRNKFGETGFFVHFTKPI